MNEQYGTDFPEPEQFKTKGSYIPSLTGSGKMSKSVEGSYINLTDGLETIKKKIASVPTDSGKGNNIEGNFKNLMIFVELFQGVEKRKSYEGSYQSEGVKYQEIKEELSNAIYGKLKPIQEKRESLTEEEVQKVIEAGGIKAREVVDGTIQELRVKMGLK